MSNFPGVDAARIAFEDASSPQETEIACDAHLPFGRHLGDPVDYGVYLIGRLISNSRSTPDFNLDSDRGYGYHCWDWNRKPVPIWDPITGQLPNPLHPHVKFYFNEPCTIPEGFCQGFPNSRVYNPNNYLDLHYLDVGNPGCGEGPRQVTPQDRDRAGIPPEGEKG
jgi:hypothetical protein